MGRHCSHEIERRVSRNGDAREARGPLKMANCFAIHKATAETAISLPCLSPRDSVPRQQKESVKLPPVKSRGSSFGTIQNCCQSLRLNSPLRALQFRPFRFIIVAITRARARSRLITFDFIHSRFREPFHLRVQHLTRVRVRACFFLTAFRIRLLSYTNKRKSLVVINATIACILMIVALFLAFGHSF